MNLAELRSVTRDLANLQSVGGRTNDAAINAAINQAQWRLAATQQGRWPGLQVVDDLVFLTPPDGDDYTFPRPSDALRVREIIAVQSNGIRRLLQYAAPSAMYGFTDRSQTGPPNIWTEDEGAIVLWPAPVQQETYEIRYTKLPPVLEEEDDEPEWMGAEMFHMAIANLAAARLLSRFADATNRIADFENEADQLMTIMREQQLQWPSSQPVVLGGRGAQRKLALQGSRARGAYPGGW